MENKQEGQGQAGRTTEQGAAVEQGIHPRTAEVAHRTCAFAGMGEEDCAHLPMRIPHNRLSVEQIKLQDRKIGRYKTSNYPFRFVSEQSRNPTGISQTLSRLTRRCIFERIFISVMPILHTTPMVIPNYRVLSWAGP
jgi:hypothetical protein